MPQGGARGQNLGTLKSVFLLFCYKNNLCRSLIRQWSTLWHWFVGHEVKVSMTYFMVQWVCLISWRLFDVWILYFRIMSPCYWTFDLKINEGQYDLHFMVQWFYLIFWKLFDVWTSYFGIMSQYDLTFDLKIFVGHCDLYFTKHNSVILPGSGTIRTKTSSSWDGSHKFSNRAVCSKLLGRFARTLIYWDNSPFFIFKKLETNFWGWVFICLNELFYLLMLNIINIKNKQTTEYINW